MRRDRADFSETETGRPVSKCPNEILSMACRCVPLRRVEIHTLANASGEDIVSTQMLHMIEQSAMRKLREAFAGVSPDELNPEAVPRGRRRMRTRCKFKT